MMTWIRENPWRSSSAIDESTKLTLTLSCFASFLFSSIASLRAIWNSYPSSSSFSKSTSYATARSNYFIVILLAGYWCYSKKVFMSWLKLSFMTEVSLSKFSSSISLSERKLRSKRKWSWILWIKYLSSILISNKLVWLHFLIMLTLRIRLYKIVRVPMRFRMGLGTSIVGNMSYSICLVKDSVSYSMVTGTSVQLYSSTIFLGLYI